MTNSLKLCVISPQGYTGIAYYDHCFCQALEEQGVPTTLATSQKWIADKTKAKYDLRMFFVDTYGEISRAQKGLNYVRGLWRTYRHVLQNKIPVVHFQLMELPIVDLGFFFLFKISGVKVVFTPHDIYSFKFQTNASLSKMFFALSDRLVVHNIPNREILVSEFGVPAQKIRQIHQGNYNAFLNSSLTKQQARLKANLPADRKIILFFGNIRQGKGAETAIRAFKEINDKKDLLFVMAGKPMRNFDMTLIRQMAGENGMKDHVLLRDHFIEDDLVEAYYKSADIVLIPYERIYVSAVICYAFSCGAATVVSDRREFQEFARHGKNCLIFKTADARDCAAKINELLRDPDLREKISSCAKKLADVEWDWTDTARNLKNIYQEIM